MKKYGLLFGVLVLLVGTISARADDFVDISSLILDVTDKNPGVETILAYVQIRDINSDNFPEVVVQFKVYKTGSTTKLYGTPTRSSSVLTGYPCTTPIAGSLDSGRKTKMLSGGPNSGDRMFLLVDSWRTCTETIGEEEKTVHISYLYSTDITRNNPSATWMKSYGMNANGIDIWDYDSDGTDEVVLSFKRKGIGGFGYTKPEDRRVIILNADTGAVEADNTYQAVR